MTLIPKPIAEEVVVIYWLIGIWVLLVILGILREREHKLGGLLLGFAGGAQLLAFIELMRSAMLMHVKKDSEWSGLYEILSWGAHWETWSKRAETTELTLWLCLAFMIYAGGLIIDWTIRADEDKADVLPYRKWKGWRVTLGVLLVGLALSLRINFFS